MFLANYSDGLSRRPHPGHRRVLPRPARPPPASSGWPRPAASTSCRPTTDGRVKSICHIKDVGMRINGGFFVLRQRDLRLPGPRARTWWRSRSSGWPRRASWSPTPTTASGPAWTRSRSGSCSRTSTPAGSRPGRSGARNPERTRRRGRRVSDAAERAECRRSAELLDQRPRRRSRPPLRDEFARDGGRRTSSITGRRRLPRLLPRPVGAVLERAARRRRPIHVTVVRQLPPRRAGLALALRGDPQPRRCCEHDISQPLPAGMPRASTTSSTPPASPRRPTTAGSPSRPWTPTSTACATCSTTRARAPARRSPVRGFLFYSSSEIYGDPLPAHIPTPEDYRGNVSCTGPAGLLRRVQALRRDAVRQLRPAARRCR